MSKYTFRRYLLFVASLFINAFGIAFITKALLGTSPITSVTYVLSLFTPFTMGIWTILLNLLFVVLEPFLMTRKDLREDLRMYLLQIPISFCFGLFIDFSMFMLSWLEPSVYVMQVTVLLIGCIILALGIALEVKANAAMMAGEYFVKTITRRFHGEFGYVKLGFDITLLTIACILSLVFLSDIQGVREGTVVSALLVGPIVHFVNPAYHSSTVGSMLPSNRPIHLRPNIQILSSPSRVNMEAEVICWVKDLPRSWASSCTTASSSTWLPNGAA